MIRFFECLSAVPWSQKCFKGDRRRQKMARQSTFLWKRNIYVQIGPSFCETTFMILLLMLSYQPSFSSSVGKEKKKKETGLVYKVAFCHLREVNFIRSTARCASHVTQSSSLLMKCCIQNSACGAQGDKTVVTE